MHAAPPLYWHSVAYFLICTIKIRFIFKIIRDRFYSNQVQLPPAAVIIPIYNMQAFSFQKFRSYLFTPPADFLFA